MEVKYRNILLTTNSLAETLLVLLFFLVLTVIALTAGWQYFY